MSAQGEANSAKIAEIRARAEAWLANISSGGVLAGASVVASDLARDVLALVALVETRLDDYVYVIHFDQDEFGIFPTREEAEESLREQIAGGGPAWEDCKVTPRRIFGG